VRTAIATVCLSGTLEEKLAAAAAAGFDGVELFENDLLASPLAPAEVRSIGLPVELYQPFRDFDSTDPAQLERNLRRAEAKFAVTEQLGAPLLLVCSSVAPDAVDDDARLAEQLHVLAERAAARGLRIAYEALAWGRHVNEYDRAWRVVEAADHPALGVCLDSFHVLSRGTPLDAMDRIPAEKLFYLQLADAPRLRMDVLQWSRHYRCFPGQGGFDLAAFTRRVLDAGYAGPLSLEVFNDVFRQADPERMARDALRSLRLLEDELGTRPLPAAPPLGGYAFVELAVDPASAGATQRVLHAIGFAPAAQHRTKPVTLWRQGAARVLLNAGADAPGVAALAAESADPAGSAARAESLLAPRLPRQRGPGEADLSAVEAPDGTSVFFSRTDWLGDFEPLTAGEEAQLVSGIDHVALDHPIDAFDEAVLFYRSVLGLEPRDSRELAGPDGLVRSRVVAGGGFRLELSVPVVPGTRGLQHVAFACPDVRAAARAMRERGVPPRPVSGNYYDDLAARTELDVSELRELDVLYDDEALYCHTPALGGRVFFELREERA
jgi:4-hydroxyphenylpyruvate dioxygenase